MSPVRNVSHHLGDVMRRSEERGVRKERRRLRQRAQARHEAAGHGQARHEAAGHGQPGSDVRACSDPVCAALSELLADPDT